MIGYLIYNQFESKRNEWFINELIKEFNSFKCNLVLLLKENLSLIINEKPIILCDNIQLEKPDFVINRTNDYRISLHFELMKVRVFNNSYVSSIANDKYLSYLKVSELNVKTLYTELLNKNSKIKSYNYNVVIKPIDGKCGKNVYLCKNIDELNNGILKIDKSDILIQKVASDLGKDLRVYILGNNIYKSMLRINKNGFLSNFCLGNDAIEYSLNKSEIDIVKRILTLSKFDFVGLDFLFDNGDLVFNEIEDSVGSRMLYSKTNLNVASDFAKYVVNTI